MSHKLIREKNHRLALLLKIGILSRGVFALPVPVTRLREQSSRRAARIARLRAAQGCEQVKVPNNSLAWIYFHSVTHYQFR
jgi:hypothetical protein